MPDYEYDNLPDSIYADPVPDELFSDVFAIITEAIQDDHAIVAEAKAVHVYDRKGYLESDEFGGKRNPSYSSSTDDVVLQVTVRVPHPSTFRRGMESLEALEQKIQNLNTAEERRRLEAEAAEADARAEQAAADAQAARERLEKLK